MGAWGTKSFDNDDALDWVGDLLDSEGHEFLKKTLELVGHEQYLDACEASQAIAAAEVVAALIGRPSEDLSEELIEWLDSQKDFDKILVEVSRKALKRVLGDDSELKDLWEESDCYEEWRGQIKELEGRLQD
ncbi:DUF4259 domain-containing protein [Paenibacillus aestuarii]|uniref:DUF4259 domain-containing protein n=1 Tax=Paenibacillus aestuarii TaxID=516965 RepID=A0ABW0KIH1_9BACL|nr:DUF4259 domain-containing protein [Paenibacillus aestuarii]